jgi:hypothetical protein
LHPLRLPSHRLWRLRRLRRLPLRLSNHRLPLHLLLHRHGQQSP